MMKKDKPRSPLIVALIAAVMAISAVSAAGASAAEFRISETGTFTGKQTSNQVFKTNIGTFTCTEAVTEGTITSTNWTILDPKVTYSKCTGVVFGAKISTPVSPAQYRLHANGEQDLLNTVTISIPAFGCSVSISPQAGLKAVSYTNKYVEERSKLEASSGLTGLSYSISGGCGSAGTNGTLSGSSLIEMVGNGSIGWRA